MSTMSVFYIEGSFGELGYHDVRITCELDQHERRGQYVSKVVKAELLIEDTWIDVLSEIRESVMRDYITNIHEQLQQEDGQDEEQTT